jgi:hypothetical protein
MPARRGGDIDVGRGGSHRRARRPQRLADERTTQRNPMCVVAVSIICAWRAAGRYRLQ